MRVNRWIASFEQADDHQTMTWLNSKQTVDPTHWHADAETFEAIVGASSAVAATQPCRAWLCRFARRGTATDLKVYPAIRIEG